MTRKKSWFATHAEYVLAITAIQMLRRLPMPLASKTARLVAALLDCAVPKLRRTARTNLLLAYPTLSREQLEKRIDGVFATIARLLLSLARFPDLNAANIGDWISYKGLENYLAAKEKGQGVLVATAHVGNWELSAFAHALMTEPMNVMVRPLDNALIDKLVEKRRALSGNRLIQKQDASRAVLRALRKNEAVGILIDQNTSAVEGVFVDFFGRKACANSGFAKLAYYSKAAVVPGFAAWDEQSGRYVLHFYPEVPLTGDDAADTQCIHAVIEKIVRQYPDQWMWIHRRWKTRPAGEMPLYD